MVRKTIAARELQTGDWFHADEAWHDAIKVLTKEDLKNVPHVEDMLEVAVAVQVSGNVILILVPDEEVLVERD